MIDTIKVNYEKDITKEILKKYSNFISKSSNLIDKKKCLVLGVPSGKCEFTTLSIVSYSTY